jgi:hypothetical protein
VRIGKLHDLNSRCPIIRIHRGNADGSSVVGYGVLNFSHVVALRDPGTQESVHVRVLIRSQGMPAGPAPAAPVQRVSQDFMAAAIAFLYAAAHSGKGLKAKALWHRVLPQT